jgi:two-component system, NarL family, capsular synthesis sensor histidine kinase RcsC
LNLEDPLELFLDRLESVAEGEIWTDYLSEKEGSSLKFELKYRKIIFQQKKALMFILRDVGMLEKLLQVQKESKYKEMLMTTVTHELRTPVNGILSNVEMLREYVPQEAQIFITVSENSCLLLINLINDILEIKLFNSQLPGFLKNKRRKTEN